MRAYAPSAASLPLDQAVGLLSGESAWLTKKVPGLGQSFVADGPHGLRARPDGGDMGVTGALPATCFPTAVTLASTWDPDLIFRVGQALGQEAKQLGVDVVLGPGLNLKRHPLCGRNFEYFSEDPFLSGVMATAITNGIQSEGVGTSVKHFAVNNQETNRFVVDAQIDMRTLHELYLRGFEMVVRGAKPWTVMAAYNLVNGVHATENPYLLQQTLRDSWGFTGLVMSDWGAVADRITGIKAGLDLEMPGSKGTWDAEVIKAVNTGDLPREAVNKCAQRVIELVERSAQLAPKKRQVTEKTMKASNRLAREAAAAGTVLLKNDGVLPLQPDTKLAVIGAFAGEPRFQGFGSSLVNAIKVTTALDGFGERGIDVEYVPGYEPLKSPDDAASLTAAVVAARKADVALVFAGLPPFYESESFDRENLLLPAQHDALITAVAAANPNTVVILFNGGPVLMPWLGSVRAVLEVYLGGQAGGGAIVDVLYGEVDPSGRLAESFPRSLADLPANANFPGEAHRVDYAEQLMVGYRFHTTAGVAPLFPFGYGLSYTRFHWTGAQVDRKVVEIPALDDGAATMDNACEVTVTVANSGKYPGSEVVQVYLSDRTGHIARPRRELAGFAKVSLKPGENKMVKVPIPKAVFGFWDEDTASWQVPSGHYELEIARNSQEVVASIPITVTGTVGSEQGAGNASDYWQQLGAAALATAASGSGLRRGSGKVSGETRGYTRDSTVTELEQTFVGRRIAAMIRKGALPEEDSELSRYMVERQVAELPIRTGAMFSGGRLTLGMVDAILAMANGKAHKVFPTALRTRLRG